MMLAPPIKSFLQSLGWKRPLILGLLLMGWFWYSSGPSSLTEFEQQLCGEWLFTSDDVPPERATIIELRSDGAYLQKRYDRELREFYVQMRGRWRADPDMLRIHFELRHPTLMQRLQHVGLHTESEWPIDSLDGDKLHISPFGVAQPWTRVAPGQLNNLTEASP